MLKLKNLESGSKKIKRIGRGGSRGGTSGKGHKGQRSRTGSRSELKPFFEGGQMPLSRRLPRRGFTNRFKKDFHILNLKDLERKFESGDTVDFNTLKEKNLIKGKKKKLIKILGKGDLTKKLHIFANHFSEFATQAIKKAGGEVNLIKEMESGSAT